MGSPKNNDKPSTKEKDRPHQRKLNYCERQEKDTEKYSVSENASRCAHNSSSLVAVPTTTIPYISYKRIAKKSFVMTYVDEDQYEEKETKH